MNKRFSFHFPLQIFYYSVSIFEKAGLSTTDAEWANLGAGCLNLATSFLGPVLMAKVNRRPLMMFSSAVCACFLFTIAFVLYYIVCTENKKNIFPFSFNHCFTLFFSTFLGSIQLVAYGLHCLCHGLYILLSIWARTDTLFHWGW